jgi:hypothetical protein
MPFKKQSQDSSQKKTGQQTPHSTVFSTRSTTENITSNSCGQILTIVFGLIRTATGPYSEAHESTLHF